MRCGELKLLVVLMLPGLSNYLASSNNSPSFKKLNQNNGGKMSPPDMVENLRLRIRDLTGFIDKEKREIFITDFADELGEVQEIDVPTQQTGFSPYQYKKKVEAYIRENVDHIAIAKLKRSLPHTDGLGGVFDSTNAKRMITIVRSFNASADTDFSQSESAG